MQRRTVACLVGPGRHCACSGLFNNELFSCLYPTAPLLSSFLSEADTNHYSDDYCCFYTQNLRDWVPNGRNEAFSCGLVARTGCLTCATISVLCVHTLKARQTSTRMDLNEIACPSPCYHRTDFCQDTHVLLAKTSGKTHVATSSSRPVSMHCCSTVTLY